jgi:hypothetical protein
MTRHLSHRRRLTTWAGLILGLVPLTLAGCGANAHPAPPADVARSALERALSAWKDGGLPGVILGSEPTVQVVDSFWQAGRKLGAFEVLREEGGESDHRFDVRLTLRKPDATQEAHYVVLGQGPIWVYRAEDYQKMADMDNNPLPRKSRGKKR